MRGKGGDSELKSEGEKLFTTERCNYCHGDGGKRFAPFAGSPPVIGGQHKTYLIKALQDIRDGKRPGDRKRLDGTNQEGSPVSGRRKK